MTLVYNKKSAFQTECAFFGFLVVLIQKVILAPMNDKFRMFSLFFHQPAR